MRLCTDECRVLGHSDQCWMPPLTSPASSSSDYRSNLYIPREESHQGSDLSPDKTLQSCSDTAPARNHSFSTFGKDSVGEDDSEKQRSEEVKDMAGGEEDPCGTRSLLSEMGNIFQRLLPQHLDSFIQVNQNHKGTSFSGVCVPITGSVDRRRGHLPGKSNPSVHQQGVATWAANTHFQNPGSSICPSGNHQVGSYHTLKPSTKLNSQTRSHKGTQGLKNSPENSGHAPKNHCSPLLTVIINPSLVQHPALVHVSVPPTGPPSKWLPAVVEIPENLEEDDFDSVLSHLQDKHSGSRHELVDANELVAEINKLLQDVRQS